MTKHWRQRRESLRKAEVVVLVVIVVVAVAAEA